MNKTFGQRSTSGQNLIIALTLSFLCFFIALKVWSPMIVDINNGTELTCKGRFDNGCGYTWHVKPGDIKNQLKCPKCQAEISDLITWEHPDSGFLFMNLVFGFPIYVWFVAWLPIWIIINVWSKAEDKVIDFIKK